MIGRDGGHEGRAAGDVIRELAGNFADSIDILGHKPKPEMEALLTRADVAVFPSYSEAFALAPMEAMALGVPTIHTTRASGREVIRHGVDGLLCDPDNTVQLAGQIESLLHNESIRRQLGEAGRRRIHEAFPYHASLQKNVEFYEGCGGA
jgi:glycosyltransferase involved in cell wall biosynthesis